MVSDSECDIHQCSNCQKHATSTCKACRAMPNDTDGQVSSAWYCGAECQKAHWTEHKPQCKAAQARQVLYRAGALLLQIFYLYTKTTFMWSPGRVEKIGATWLIHPGDYSGTSLLMPFPNAEFPDVHDQEALLAYQACNSAVSYMHNTVKTLLRGLFSKVDEVAHHVKGANYHMRRVFQHEGLPRIDGTDYKHTIIRVTMKDGGVFALDMTGAQYGWSEPVTPWQLYSTSRVREIKEVTPFGGTRVSYKRAHNDSKQREWIHGMMENFAEIVDHAVAQWVSGNLSSHELLRLPEHEFQKRRASLVDAIDGFMHRYKAFQESLGGFNVSGSFMHKVPDRKFTSSALGGVSPAALDLLKDGVRGSSLFTPRV